MSIEAYPSPNGVLTSLIWRKTAAGGETSLSGYDNASQALSYTPGQEQVYLNGILLVRGSDYTATNGTSITGLTALAADDFVQINCYNNFSVASVPAASITGEVTNSQITSLATTKLTGTITNAQLAGSIANDKLANSSITINGSAVALGGSATIAGGSAQDTAPSSPTEGQLWLDTDGTLATTAFVEKSVLTTTGDVLYASSANTPARLGIGSNGQVLGISSGVPAWTTPSSGGMTQLATGSLSNANLNLTSISGSYKNLQLNLDVTHGSGNPFQVFLRFNGNSGSVYTAVIPNATRNSFNAGDGFTDSASFRPHSDSFKAGTYGQIIVNIYDYASTTAAKCITTVAGGKDNNNNQSMSSGALGHFNSTTAITSIESITNPLTGTYTLYGVK